LRAKRY